MKPADNQATFISQQVLEGQYYFLNLNPDFRRPVTVVCGGCEHCSPQYAIDRNDFQYYPIEYVSSGKGEITLQGKPINSAVSTSKPITWMCNPPARLLPPGSRLPVTPVQAFLPGAYLPVTAALQDAARRGTPGSFRQAHQAGRPDRRFHRPPPLLPGFQEALPDFPRRIRATRPSSNR